ncbi:MAG TPA: cytosine permease [Trebonia sp.]|jgi:purine-cytosine permease-like protein
MALGHRTGEREAPSTIGRRVGGEIETVGVAPVPDNQRVQTPRQMFIVWLMASASATTPLIGALLFKFGLTDLIIAIVASFLIGVIPAGLFSEMGREVPLSALVVARKTYGWDGSLLFSVLFSLVNLGWFGLNTEVGAQILSAITHSSVYLWDVIVGALQVVLVLFGMKWLERFYRYTVLILIAAYLALTIYLVTHFTLHYPGQTEQINWGSALTTVLTFSILAWTYKLSTTSRFAVPSSKTGGTRASYFLAAPVGIMLAVLVFGILGTYSNQATGNWNIALLGSSITGWGFVAAIGAALAVIHTNAMNLYPSTVDLLVALNNVRPPARWQQPVATITLGILGTILAIAGILDHVQTLISDAGDIIIPFTFVMLVDWLYVQRKRTPATAFFNHPRNLADRVVPSAIIAVAIGFVFAFWGQDFMPGFFYNTLPLPVVAGVISAILYGLAAHFWRPPQAALPATDVAGIAPDSPAAQPGTAS